MKNFTVIDGDRKFTRISKPMARKLFNQGAKIALCPFKCNPCGFYMSAFITQKSEDNSDFNKLVNSYEHYNCSQQLGKYAAFYMVEGA